MMKNTLIMLINRPLVFFLIVAFPICIFTRFFIFMLNKRCQINHYWQRLLLYSSIYFIILYFTLVVSYIFSAFIFDHIEPSFMAIAWLYSKGQQIYHDPDSPARYSLVYGPLGFLLVSYFMKVFGPSILSAKLGGGLSALGGLILAHFSFKKSNLQGRALIYTGLLAAFLLLFAPTSYWTRPDSFIFFFSALGLYASLLSSSILASLICGLALACVINLKIHGFFYFIPIIAICYKMHGLRYFFLLFAAVITFVLIPYISPYISFGNMVYWLHIASRHGINRGFLLYNIDTTIYILLPIIFCIIYICIYNRSLLKDAISNYWIYIASLILGLIPMVILGAKNGAGTYYIMPFLPVMVYYFACLNETISSNVSSSISKYQIIIHSLVLAFLLPLFVSSFHKANYIIVHIRCNFLARNIIKDLNNIMESNPNTTIGMGLADNSTYSLTYYRPILLFAGNPFLFEAGPLMDNDFGGVSLPLKTIGEIKSGFYKIILIPKGKDPFLIDNGYSNQRLFSDEFRKIFLSNFKNKGQSHYYDLWYYSPR